MGEKRKYETEWSFSFDRLGDSINGFFTSLGTDEEIQFASFAEAVEGASSAEVNLNFSVCELFIKHLVGSDNLIEADVSYYGEMIFEADGDDHRTISLKQKGATTGAVVNTVKNAFRSKGKRDDLRWDVRLTHDIPLALNLNSGIGRSEIDLSMLKLTSLSHNGGTGETIMTLPTSDAGYDATLNVGVGSTKVTLPDNTALNLTVSAGVGEVKLQIPPTAAVRVNVSGGLNEVNVPKHFTKLAGSGEFIGKSGLWETPGFAEAEHQITIEYSGGVGEFSIVNEVEMV